MASPFSNGLYRGPRHIDLPVDLCHRDGVWKLSSDATAARDILLNLLTYHSAVAHWSLKHSAKLVLHIRFY